MDVLSDILASIHLGGGVQFHCELSAPWGMELKPAPVAQFHLVTRGSCWLRVPGQREPIALRSGDLVAFLDGGAHRLLDAPGTRARPVEEIAHGQDLERYGPLVHGGGGLPASVLCGYFEFDRDSRHPLVAALPPMIHLRDTDRSELAWLQTTLNFMVNETKAARPGAAAVVNRLVGVLFIQMVRTHLEQSRTPPTLLSAIADRRIGAALQVMHQKPQHPWTLEALARSAGMSRSAFAARFREFAGQTPMQYLTFWRMQVARKLLGETRLATAAIAERSGYESEAAFSKAFKKVIGVGPGAYRRQASTRIAT